MQQYKIDLEVSSIVGARQNDERDHIVSIAINYIIDIKKNIIYIGNDLW